MVKNNGCNCSKESGPVCAMTNVRPADLDDQEELNIECKSSVPAEYFGSHIEFTEEGWEPGGDLDVLDTEQDKCNRFDMPTFRPEDLFTEENDWPADSQNYLISKHNDGSGLKGIVF